MRISDWSSDVCSSDLSADNLGSRSTGRNQMALTGTAEGLLGLNEFISVTRRQSRPLNDGPNRSSSENYFGSVPLGPLTFSGGYPASRYRTVIDTPSGVPLELTGNRPSGFEIGRASGRKKMWQ